MEYFGGGMVMIFRDQFATESGRSRKLQPRWRGHFVIIGLDEHTKNSILLWIQGYIDGREEYSSVQSSSTTTLTMISDSLEGPTPNCHLS